jgi:glycosyltransferase involved in cell wall biosynthesis
MAVPDAHCLPDERGISVVICAHNSAERLPETLKHLRAQKTPPDLKWEIILVDNASTDDTAAVSERCWPNDGSAPLRVVHEPRLGLTFARERGIEQARYDVVVQIDDDNWIDPTFLEAAASVMASHPEIAVAGGDGVPRCELTPPAWFDRVKGGVSFGHLGEAHDITEDPGMVSGAGLVLRKHAFQEIRRRGFSSMLTDRVGNTGSAGGDLELCLGLRLAGWRLWYDPRMSFEHFIPRERFDWARWRREARGAGAAYPVIGLYGFAMRPDEFDSRSWIRRTWLWQLLGALAIVARHPLTLLRSRVAPMEGEIDVLETEVAIGRVSSLFALRKSWRRSLESLRARKFQLS